MLVAGTIYSPSSTASYDSKNVGPAKTITANNFVVTGSVKQYYNLTNTTATTTGTITAKALTASAAPVTKVYDGAATATLSFSALNSAAGLVGTDDVALTYTSAAYNDKNVANGKAITITGLSLTGTERNNYALNAFSTTGARLLPTVWLLAMMSAQFIPALLLILKMWVSIKPLPLPDWL